MVNRHNNQLPDNLPQLQNLIKRDPASYKDEFLQQHRHYQSTLEVFRLRPGQFNKSLDELVMFLSQVSHCYADVLTTYPQELMDILQTHHTVLDMDMRMTFCRALILLRNKNLLAPTDLLALFFSLLRCHDKSLRKFLEAHIITDIKNQNSKHKDARLNTSLQNFMFGMLKDSNSKASKMSVDIMIELYKKNVWNDTKTVNVIATACFSKFTKVLVAALKFFLGSDPDEKESDDSDSDNAPNTKDVIMANKVNKKSRKRVNNLKKVKAIVKKNKKKKSEAVPFNFSALHLVHDPQGLAEKLFRQLETTNERFEVKLMTLDVISRLIGLHQLFLFNFYPYIQRFIQPHQREVTKILQFAAQASHELVPPDVIEPVIKTLVYNFVTERNSGDVMAIGLNAVCQICSRCPLVMSEELLRDLAMYKNYRDRSVMMAARSLIHLYRASMPDLLHKRDRGRPTQASIEISAKQYGEVKARDYIPGAEVLLRESTADDEKQNDSDSDSADDDQWVDVLHSSDEENITQQEDEDDEDDVESGGSDGEEESGSEVEEECEISQTGESTSGTPKPRKILKAVRNLGKKSASASTEIPIKSKAEQAQEASTMRIMTDEDFRRIDAAVLSKKITNAKKDKKRPLDADDANKGELVSLADIENIYKKRRHDRASRRETVKEGREGREKFGYKDGRIDPHSSKTNREKNKNKSFMMVKHKVRGKIKRSFKDKQVALRNHLIKQKKMK